MAQLDSDVEKVFAHLPEVQAEVSAGAREVLAAWETEVAPHRKTGEYEASINIEITPSGVDRLVTSDGASIELGHITTNGKWVHGIFAGQKAIASLPEVA